MQYMVAYRSVAPKLHPWNVQCIINGIVWYSSVGV
jgi:hypothetical protein